MIALLAGASLTGSVRAATDLVRLIVPYPSGGTTDQVARIIVPSLNRTLRETLYVENRAGASGTLGTATIAQASRDGTTLGLGTVSTLALVPSTRRTGYDPLRSFETIGTIAAAPFMVVVHPALGLDSLDGLVRHLKSAPDELNYGSVGEGSLPHLTALRFQAVTGTRMTHIPYTSAAAAKFDMMAGRIQVMFDQLATFSADTLRSGVLKALAVMSDRRLPQIPDVPTVDELHYPTLHATMWLGLIGPAGMDAAVVGRLNGALQRALADASVVVALESVGLQPMVGTPADFRRFLASEVQAHRSVAPDMVDEH